jgi:Glutathione S-transferase, N-terminal domain
MKAPEYLSLNPMGKVPAIRHGDTVVTECAAICAYLADGVSFVSITQQFTTTTSMGRLTLNVLLSFAPG